MANCRQTQIFIICGVQPHFCFFGDKCVEKTPCRQKPQNFAVFKNTGAVLAGIEYSPKISDFRASGIPVQERGDFVDTLTYII